MTQKKSLKPLVLTINTHTTTHNHAHKKKEMKNENETLKWTMAKILQNAAIICKNKH